MNRYRPTATAALLGCVLIAGCGSAAHSASPTMFAASALSGSSTCADWAKASFSQRNTYAGSVAATVAVPSRFQGAEVDAYLVGAISGKCHDAEVAGQQITIAEAVSQMTSSATATNTTTSPSSAETQATPATDQSAMANNPVVSFMTGNDGSPVIPGEHDTWRFTAQLVSITTSPNGFPPGYPSRPKHAMLMVQVNITSQTSGRMVPLPVGLNVICKSPSRSSWNSDNKAPGEGWDEGPEAAPDSTGAHIAMGDGQPHAWDTEWEIPEGTSISDVKCWLQFGYQGNPQALN